MFRLSPRLIISLALSMLVFAGLCTPSLVEWLFNYDAYSQLFTVSEIALFRLALALLGSALLIGAGLWSAGRNTLWRKRIEKDYEDYLADPVFTSRKQGKFVRLWWMLTFFVLLGCIQTMRWSFIYHGKGVYWYDLLALENGFWETLTAVSLMFAGGLFFVGVMKFGDDFGLKIARWPSLVLGILLVFGAGEEVSWGQHWVGFATPEFIKSINIQNEVNFHNINSAFANHLMVVFFFFYVGVLPLFARLFREVRFVLERLNIPICPLILSPFAFVGVIMSDYGAFSDLWGNPPMKIQEGRETLFGVIMMGVSIRFFLVWKERYTRKRDDPPESPDLDTTV